MSRPRVIGGSAQYQSAALLGKGGRERASRYRGADAQEHNGRAVGGQGRPGSGGLLEAPLAGRNGAAHRSCTPRTSP